MSTYSLSHVSDHVLLRDLAALVARDRSTTAVMLAHIAEVDARRLYAPAAQPSMHSYCVHVLRLSEDAASKRIQAARAARRFPAVFDALADGRLHLSAVNLLAPHLTAETADELLTAATHKTKAEIERLLAERFPNRELEMLAQPASAVLLDSPGAGGPMATLPGQHAPGHVGSMPGRARVTPLSEERVEVQVTLSRSTHDKLKYAQALASHRIRPGDVAEIIDRALDVLIRELEKRKFGATEKPRATMQRSNGARHVPAHVRRAVWLRDGGQCTFVSEAGHRCPSRTLLEFDHVEPVARGGQASVGGIRLRCRTHNQYAAEQAFGAEFMRHKREQAQEAAAQKRAHVAGRGGQAEEPLRAQQQTTPGAGADVIPWLLSLGFKATEARRAAAFCDGFSDAPLEQRVRIALSYFHGPRGGESPRAPRTGPSHGRRDCGTTGQSTSIASPYE